MMNEKKSKKEREREEIKQKVCATRCKMIAEYTDYELDEKCAECPLNDL